MILAGLAQTFIEDGISEITIQEWPDELQKAYRAQDSIGWVHFLYGRISQKWRDLAEDMTPGAGSQWTRKTIRIFWSYGLDLWTLRNSMVHGPHGGISQLEKEKIDKMVSAIYTQILPQRYSWSKDIFTTSRSERVA